MKRVLVAFLVVVMALSALVPVASGQRYRYRRRIHRVYYHPYRRRIHRVYYVRPYRFRRHRVRYYYVRPRRRRYWRVYRYRRPVRRRIIGENFSLQIERLLRPVSLPESRA